MKTIRVCFAAVLAVVIMSGYSGNAQAQYLRHALIEEGTGNWCGYCPYGAFTIDSMIAAMKENLVAISWHGPSGYGDPLYLTGAHPTAAAQPMDTLAAFDSIQGYPWASIGRDEVGANFSGAYVQGGSLIWPNPWYQVAQTQAEQAPVVDFRVVNAAYNGTSVDFDLDITPFDLSVMPSEDTSTYVTVAVLTEDGPQTTQDIYEQSYNSIDGFVNENVAREVGGKVLGDPFSVKTATSLPIRRHYHMAANNSNKDWNEDSLRIKAFAAVTWAKTYVGTKSITSSGAYYLDAGQTGYITGLPSTPPPALWQVLPVANASFDGDSVQIPIVWAAGGGVTSVAIDYSTDNGKDWASVVSATSISPYEWQLPSAVYGQTVELRLSDPAKNASDSIGANFSIGPKPVATIIVNSPMAGDSLLVGTTQPIDFTVGGPVDESSLRLDYSTDGMKTWDSIASVANKTSYSWVIPDVPTTTTAAVRVIDKNGAFGTSPIFAIVDTGVVSNVTVTGAPDLLLGALTTVNWTATGYLGESVDVRYFAPGSITGPVSIGLPASATNTIWQTGDNINTATTGITVQVKYASGATGTSQPFNIGSSGVTPDAAVQAMMLSPNPFSGTASLRFGMNNPAEVTLVVHNLLGQEVLRTDEGTLAAGDHTLTIDGSTLPAGSYQYTLTAGNNSSSGKLTILR